MLRLLMASEDGYLYVYSLDVNEGGDCALIRQFHLSSRNEEAVSNVEAVKMEQQQLEATTTNSSASPTPPDQVDSTSSSPPPPTKLSENSEKFHEMAAAADSPPKQCFLLDDDGEFPPMNKAGHKA